MRAVTVFLSALVLASCASAGSVSTEDDAFGGGFRGGESLTMTVENDFEMPVSVRVQWGVGVDTELLATIDPGRILEVPLFRDGPTARALIINASGRQTTSNRADVGPEDQLRLVIDQNYKAVLRAR